MIRVDEIYNNTFWPWLRSNRPGTRLFFCDPFGHTSPESLYNHGSDIIHEGDYVFMHDQEPIQITAHQELFEDVMRRNLDIRPQPQGHVIVSERGRETQRLCDIYGWRSHYYFFHGWACLDWYRGYDRTFLIPPPEQRHPRRSFMSPNRIIGGQRDHRVLFIYHVAQRGLDHSGMSAPWQCPYEGTVITDIAAQWQGQWADIQSVLASAELPWLYPGESAPEMSSCWLDNFDLAADSLIYVPTETVYWGDRTHLTEKTFKAIALGMPFALVAPAGSLEYLREYGFQTFGDIWDESYDHERDDLRRMQRVVQLLADIDAMSHRERQQIHRCCLPRVQHNWDHFYHGGFERVLWSELTNMLGEL